MTFWVPVALLACFFPFGSSADVETEPSVTYLTTSSNESWTDDGFNGVVSSQTDADFNLMDENSTPINNEEVTGTMEAEKTTVEMDRHVTTETNDFAVTGENASENGTTQEERYNETKIPEVEIASTTPYEPDRGETISEMETTAVTNMSESETGTEATKFEIEMATETTTSESETTATELTGTSTEIPSSTSNTGEQHTNDHSSLESLTTTEPGDSSSIFPSATTGTTHLPEGSTNGPVSTKAGYSPSSQLPNNSEETSNSDVSLSPHTNPPSTQTSSNVGPSGGNPSTPASSRAPRKNRPRKGNNDFWNRRSPRDWSKNYDWKQWVPGNANNKGTGVRSGGGFHFEVEWKIGK